MSTYHRNSILLVEDEPIVAMSEKSTLQKHGYSVIVSNSGEDAIMAFRAHDAIDLVLMDIELGSGIDGPETAGRILQEYSVPIVFLSSHTEPEVVEKTERITSYGYVVKDSGETILLSAIKMALRLFDAKSRYRDIFTHSINGISVHRMIYDNSGRPYDCEFLEINDSYTDHTGLTQGTVIGHTMREVFPNEDTSAVIAFYAKVLHTGIPKRTEAHFSPTGKWFDLSVYPTGSDQFTVVLQDVSELKRQKEKYQKIFDLTPALISITGTDGYFRELNAAWETTLGYTLEELKGRPLTDFMHPDDVEPTQREIRNQLDGGTTKSFINRYRHKDGSYRYFEWEATPAEGTSLYAVARDVTARKTTEQKLQATLERYRKLTEGAHAILWEYDIQSDRWSYVAPQVEKILGYAPAEWTGFQFWLDRIYEADRHWARDYCLECTARGEAHTFEYRFLAKNGSIVWLRDVVNVEMAEEDPVRLRGLMIDITERKEAEDALRERIKELDCLYRISEIVEEREITLEEILQKSAETIPPSWQYPTSTVCRITVDDTEYTSDGFTASRRQQKADLYVEGEEVGAVEVHYTEEHEPADEGPFLHEERRLIEAVAKRLGRVIERTRRQKALDRERVLLSTVLDTLDAAVVICDEHARIIRFNDTARRLHGIPETPVPSDRWAEYYELYMEDGKTPLPTEQIPLFRAFKGEYVQNAHIIVSPKGGNPRRLSCNGARLIDNTGELHGAVIAMHDITDRHETETRLVESEAKYRSLIEDVLDSSDVAIFILDSRFRIVWVNAAAEKYFGIQRDQALGTEKKKLISGHIKGIMEAPDLFEQYMVSSFETNDHVQRFECHVLENPEEGLQERWLEHWSKPIEHGLYAGGRVEHYTDISKRKSANQRVHELVEEKEHLLKEVQHRIKNTMNTMVSMLSMQAYTIRQSNPDAATALNDAKSRFQSMEVLYDQLYRTETHESGSLPEYLTQLIQSVLSLSPSGETVEISTDMDNITLDAKRLSTVGIIVNELVTNAMKYAFASRGSGKLFVSALRNGDRIAVTVADDGPGLPDTFKNVRESSFGMSMIEALSEQLEGTIKFEHDGGLRTTIEFPQ